MDYLADLAARSLLVFSLLLFLCFLIAYAVGFRLGSRRRAVHGEGQSDGIGLVVSGLLALLAFTLAMTLSFSSDRFMERRAGTLAEANAIGTAWLLAKAIGHPQADQIADRLGEYGRLRKEYVQAPRGSPSLLDIDRRGSALENEIWTHSAAIAHERSDAVVAALMTALNTTFDAGTAERFAIETGLPAQLFWLLIGMALISLGTFGYLLGVKNQRVHMPVVLLTAVWTTVMVAILDLSAPRLGSGPSVAVYDWTLQRMQGLQTEPAQTPTK
jgi:hypothetical protein